MPPEIADAEWVVMRAVWDADRPVTAAEVVEAVAPHVDWSAATTKTLLNRLLGKGVLAAKAEGRRYLYRAAVSREACVRDEGRSFLDRIFGGSGGALLTHFVRHTKLTAAEIAELRAMLEEKKGKS
jgi:BlaI family transcriptional regulator, penicillinase repressor